MAVAVRADETLCPYCGQPISRKQYREIRAQIQAEETAHIAKVEQTLKDRYAEQMKLAQGEPGHEYQAAATSTTRDP
jgi:uncharacterized Zn finger protein (UPF0148 family)